MEPELKVDVDIASSSGDRKLKATWTVDQHPLREISSDAIAEAVQALQEEIDNEIIDDLRALMREQQKTQKKLRQLDEPWEPSCGE